MSARVYGCVGILVMLAALVTSGSAVARDVEHERMTRSLGQLETDPRLATFAATEIARARTALLQLQEASRKQREHLLYMAERRVDIAWATAQVADLDQQAADLEREHARLQIAVARHEADLARKELERQRMFEQIRAEEAERLAREAEAALAFGEQVTAAAREEAEQARRLAEAQAQAAALARREAELAGAAADALRVRLNKLQATRGERGMQMTLDDVAFGSGRATLREEARQSLGTMVEFVNREPEKDIRIEGHTDSSGNPNANQVLSQRRAESVRDALVGAGVDRARMTAIGLGSERPLDTNETAEGRAKNRRVDVILVEKQ